MSNRRTLSRRAFVRTAMSGIMGIPLLGAFRSLGVPPNLLAAVYSASDARPQELSTSAEAASAARWLQSEDKVVPPWEAKLLRRAQATLLGNLVTSSAWAPYHGVEPAIGQYRGIWNWDSAFHAIAISHWDPALARQQFDILFSKQLPSGALPDVIWAKGGDVTTVTKPPVMTWAVAVVDRRSPNTAYLQKMYPKLIRLGDFFLNERGGAKDGLFYYAGSDVGYDSGWDNAIRWDDGYRYARSDKHRLWAIDLNCYMVMHYRAMTYIAHRLGLQSDGEKWASAADQLAAQINDKLWDEKLGFYVDRDRTTGEDGPALSPAGFMPLFVYIASAQRAARVTTLAADPHKFYPGMPTAAYDTPGSRIMVIGEGLLGSTPRILRSKVSSSTGISTWHKPCERGFWVG